MYLVVNELLTCSTTLRFVVDIKPNSSNCNAEYYSVFKLNISLIKNTQDNLPESFVLSEVISNIVISRNHLNVIIQ